MIEAAGHRKQQRESLILIQDVTVVACGESCRRGADPSWRLEERRSKVAAHCVILTKSFSACRPGHLEISRGWLCHSCVWRLRPRHHERKTCGQSYVTGVERRTANRKEEDGVTLGVRSEDFSNVVDVGDVYYARIPRAKVRGGRKKRRSGEGESRNTWKEDALDFPRYCSQI
jgi:hypothetical protein